MGLGLWFFSLVGFSLFLFCFVLFYLCFLSFFFDTHTQEYDLLAVSFNTVKGVPILFFHSDRTSIHTKHPCAGAPFFLPAY